MGAVVLEDVDQGQGTQDIWEVLDVLVLNALITYHVIPSRNYITSLRSGLREN